MCCVYASVVLTYTLMCGHMGHAISVIALMCWSFLWAVVMKPKTNGCRLTRMYRILLVERLYLLPLWSYSIIFLENVTVIANKCVKIDSKCAVQHSLVISVRPRKRTHKKKCQRNEMPAVHLIIDHNDSIRRNWNVWHHHC